MGGRSTKTTSDISEIAQPRKARTVSILMLFEELSANWAVLGGTGGIRPDCMRLLWENEPLAWSRYWAHEPGHFPCVAIRTNSAGITANRVCGPTEDALSPWNLPLESSVRNAP